MNARYVVVPRARTKPMQWFSTAPDAFSPPRTTLGFPVSLGDRLSRCFRKLRVQFIDVLRI